MKKSISILLIIIISFVSFCPVIAKEDVQAYPDKYIEHDTTFKRQVSLEDIEYYPFIYSKKNQWEIDNIIGPSNCQEGFLYSLNVKTNEIKQLINVKVNKIFDCDDKIYFINHNSIYSIDYLGKNLTKYYTGKNYINENFIKYNDGYIYFLEGDVISRINEHTFELSTFIKCNGIELLHIKSNDEIIYVENNNTHLYRVAYEKDRIIKNESEINYLFVDKTYEYSNDIYRSPVNPAVQEDSNLQYVFSLYPNGSYFSNNGSACTHHTNFDNSHCSYYGNCNCKPYCGAIQCIGFAKNVSDIYAHKSSWNAVNGDINETDVQLSTNAIVNAYFNNLKTGAYILLAHDSEANNGRHFHAMVYIKKTSNGVMTYECNLGSNCNVELLSRSYSAIVSLYSSDWAIYSVSHKFNGTCQQYNDTYHKKYCSSSGCGGYIYEAHYATFTGGNATCIKCGYNGPIYYTEGLVQGTY